MTSSGRRVKRRNFDESDGNIVRSNRNRKPSNSQKASKRRKSSKSKSSRPQRAAARNARSLFSKITGTSTDGDEDGSDSELSGSESTLQDSNIESEESSRSLVDDQIRNSKGKEIVVDEYEDVGKIESHASQVNAGTRARLVLRLPIRDSSKLGQLEHISDKFEKPGTSSEGAREATEDKRKCIISFSKGDIGEASRSLVERNEKGQSDKSEGLLNFSEGYKTAAIRWGGSRTRTTKRRRSRETMSSVAYAGPIDQSSDHKEKDEVDCNVQSEENGIEVPHRLEVLNCENKKDEAALKNVIGFEGEASGILSCEARNKDCPSIHELKDSDTSTRQVNLTDGCTTAHPVSHQNDDYCPPEPTDSHTTNSTKLRVMPSIISDSAESPNPLISSDENGTNGLCGTLHDNSLDLKHNSGMDAIEDSGTNRTSSDLGADGSQQLDTHIDSATGLHDSRGLGSHSKKMFNVVYRRSKNNRGRTNSEGDSAGVSNMSHNKVVEETTNGLQSTRSNGLEVATGEPDNVSNNLSLGEERDSELTCRISRNRSMSRHQNPSEEWGSSSRMTVRARSTRNRRNSYNYNSCDQSVVDRRKMNQSSRKGSWLMLSAVEKGSRYIPQLGDEIVYLRQVCFCVFDV